MFSIILSVLGVLVSAQETSIKGFVTDSDDNPLSNVTISLNEGEQTIQTNTEGRFEFKELTEGDFFLDFKLNKYKDVSEYVGLEEGESIALNIVMDRANSLDEVVVTGSSNPKKKIESSVAITTMGVEQIKEAAPQSSADLLKSVPGIYVESSGGEAGNNIFVRGIPADGSFRYVSVEEDGMPVFASPEAMFGNIDNYFRVDETVKRLEAVRGGSSSIFASNAPGGIINLISKTGDADTEGIVKMSVGDYGLFRTDFNVGGPLSEEWRYNIGGFYRVDDGVRDVGFTANQGGQLKANLTRNLNNGKLKLYGKYLNDRNTFYLPIPVVVDGNKIEDLSGVDKNYGTLATPELQHLSAPMPGGGLFTQDLQDGIHNEMTTIGAVLDLDLGSGWKLREHIKRSDIDTRFNAIFSLSNPLTASDFVSGKYGLTMDDVQFSYALSGETLTETQMNSLNGNGLVAEVGWWSVGLKMDDIANKLEVTKKLDKVSLNLGYFYQYDNQAAQWYWQDALVEVKDKPSLLDVTNTSTGQALTDHGYTRYGSTYLNYDFSTSLNAFFINADWEATEKLTIDAGFRLDTGKIEGETERTASNDLGGDTAADDNVTFGTGVWDNWDYDYTDWSASIGVNYAFNNQNAVFGRISRGFRAPDDNNLVFSNGYISNGEEIDRETVWQGEVGYKYFGRTIGLFASGFYSSFQNLPFTSVLGDGSNTTVYADSETFGLELESRINYKQFGLNINGTFQSAQYKSFEGIDPDSGASFNNTDNKIKRIPEMYFGITPHYTFILNEEKGSQLKWLYTWRFVGDRYADPANTNELPAYHEFNSSVLYDMNEKLNFTFTVNNIFNGAGLTEGNPREDGLTGSTSSFKQARPILGRNFVASIAYKF